VLVVLTLARVHVATWQRLAWQDHWRTIAPTPLALPVRPLIFLTFQPSAFLALSLPAEARYVDLDCDGINLCGPSDTTLTRQLRTELEAVPPYSLYAVIPGDSAIPRISGLAAYGLRLGTQCQQLAVADKVFLICAVLR
jgi:hypothetical protein